MKNSNLPNIVWLSLIKDETIRKQALNNLIEEYSFSQSSCMFSAISSSFDFKDSKEGDDYWEEFRNDIYRKPRNTVKFDKYVTFNNQEEYNTICNYYGCELTHL